MLQPPEVKEAQPAQQSSWARNLKIGAAAVAGGTILAVTGVAPEVPLSLHAKMPNYFPAAHAGPHAALLHLLLSCVALCCHCTMLMATLQLSSTLQNLLLPSVPHPRIQASIVKNIITTVSIIQCVVCWSRPVQRCKPNCLSQLQHQMSHQASLLHLLLCQNVPSGPTQKGSAGPGIGVLLHIQYSPSIPQQ